MLKAETLCREGSGAGPPSDALKGSAKTDIGKIVRHNTSAKTNFIDIVLFILPLLYFFQIVRVPAKRPIGIIPILIFCNYFIFLFFILLFSKLYHMHLIITRGYLKIFS